MSITPDIEARIRDALDPDDYQTLVEEVEEARREARSARLEATTQKSRADANHDTITRLTQDGAADRRLAQIGRTVAMRFQNPRLTYSEEQEARQALIDAHLNPEGATS